MGQPGLCLTDKFSGSIMKQGMHLQGVRKNFSVHRKKVFRFLQTDARMWKGMPLYE